MPGGWAVASGSGCCGGDAAVVTAAPLATAGHCARNSQPPPLPSAQLAAARPVHLMHAGMLGGQRGGTHNSPAMSSLLFFSVSPHPATNSPSPTRSMRLAGASLIGGINEGSDSTIRAMSLAEVRGL